MYDYVIARLFETPPRMTRAAFWDRVARDTKINRRTLEKIARGEIVDPGVSHIEALAKYFCYTPRKAQAMVKSQKRQQRLAAEA